ncbi:MAG: hypothetical protein HFI75_08555 [Lachnospiraceae bacterium]|nr:hypothetical protein [Lachnospiraceae bacterium]
MVKVKDCYLKHKSAFEEWIHGKPKKSWIDEDGILCIMYEDSTWWHYQEKNGNLEWW